MSQSLNRLMQAVVQYALKPMGVELRRVEPPGSLADDEVLLATRAVGICGSEVHQYHNTHSWPVRVPVILGHEFAGVVSRVGAQVRGFSEGERVVSETAARICGRCAYCRVGEYNLCPERQGFGYNLDGGMAEFVAVPARCLHRLPDSIPFEQTALDAVRPNGRVTKVGWGAAPLNFSLDPLVRKAVRLQGSFSHNYAIWEKVIALLASGRLDPTPLIGRVEKLSNWQACFDEMG